MSLSVLGEWPLKSSYRQVDVFLEIYFERFEHTSVCTTKLHNFENIISVSLQLAQR